MTPRPGLTATVDHTVTDDDTAIALGSGDVPVLGTPRVVALLEAATVAAVAAALDDGATTVGTRVAVEHLTPTAVGATVSATATLAAADGRTLTFDVSATDSSGAVVARGTVVRAAVDRARFLSRVTG